MTTLPPMSDEKANEIAAQVALIEDTITKLAAGGAKAVVIATVHPVGADDARQVMKVVTLKQIAGHPRLIAEALQKLNAEFEAMAEQMAAGTAPPAPKIITEH